MFLTDNHLHTNFSFDGEAEPEAVCLAAIGQGLSEIALTDHMDIFSDKPYTYILDCDRWYATMKELQEKYRNVLRIHLGIELGQPQCNPKEARDFLAKYPLDFIIGSVHNMENDIDVFEYDFKTLDYRQVYANYVQWLKTLAIGYDFDIMGHVTYPSRYIYIQTGIKVDVMAYREQFADVFKILIESGRGIELNLSGLARGQGGTMPEDDLLRLYRACGGEIITLGSDAHVADQVGSVAARGQELLKAAGFKYFTYFEGRKPQFVKL